MKNKVYILPFRATMAPLGMPTKLKTHKNIRLQELENILLVHTNTTPSTWDIKLSNLHKSIHLAC